ncbi:MAG: hypothetical protein LBV67_07230 [Streptococcaceae bacterium]|jgi:PHD/YefM family antitoxin component YafN of YafNO toxin-antitoxin module|nr:hypothetical protein [Streptococcaceae bacterium]
MELAIKTASPTQARENWAAILKEVGSRQAEFHIPTKHKSNVVLITEDELNELRAIKREKEMQQMMNDVYNQRQDLFKRLVDA